MGNHLGPFPESDQPGPSQNRPDQLRASQNRSDRPAQTKSEQVRAAQTKPEQVRPVLNWSELFWLGLSWLICPVLTLYKLVWPVLAWSGLVWHSLSWSARLWLSLGWSDFGNGLKWFPISNNTGFWKKTQVSSMLRSQVTPRSYPWPPTACTGCSWPSGQSEDSRNGPKGFPIPKTWGLKKNPSP